MAKTSKSAAKKLARKRLNAEHALEKARAERRKLDSITLSLSRRETTADDLARAAKAKMPKMPVRFLEDSTRDLPSVETRSVGTTIKSPVKYKGDLAVREAVAQKEIESKKKRVAILVNKSSYQYVSDGMDPKTLGRK
jgi:hypothetical protein